MKIANDNLEQPLLTNDSMTPTPMGATSPAVNEDFNVVIQTYDDAVHEYNRQITDKENKDDEAEMTQSVASTEEQIQTDSGLDPESAQYWMKHPNLLMAKIEELDGEIPIDFIMQVQAIRNERPEYAERLRKAVFSNPRFFHKYIRAPEPKDFAFRSIYYKKGDTQFLTGINGYCRKGQILAMLGAPDSQMDTLLRILAQRDVGGDPFGTIWLGGAPPQDDYHLHTVYVPKYEVNIPTLTVKESVFSSLRMRLDPHVPQNLIIARTAMVLSDLGLWNVKDSLVGDARIRGISGGEKRRLTIACELGGSGTVHFLDLPTNGLDSATAYKLFEGFRRSCQLGQSFVCTLAQPAPELLNLCDNLLLMAKGHQIYFGNPQNALEYFAQFGYLKPERMSYPDFLQEMTGDPYPFYNPGQDYRDTHYFENIRQEQTYLGLDTKGLVPEETVKVEVEPGTWQDLALCWRNSKEFKVLGLKLWEDFEPQFPFETNVARSRTSVGRQLSTLIWRQWTFIVRNPELAYGRILMGAIMGLIFGSLYFDLSNKFADARGRLTIMFFLSFVPFMQSMQAIPFITKTSVVHCFQVSSSYYFPWLYYLSIQAIDIIWMLMEMFMFNTVLFFMVGLKGPYLGEHFLFQYLMTVLCSNAGRVTVTTLTLVFLDQNLATVSGNLMTILIMFSSGYMIPQPNLVNFWKFLWWLNPVAKAFKALAMNELWGREFDGGIDYKIILHQFGIDEEHESDKWQQTYYLIIYWVCINIICAITCKFCVRENFVETILDGDIIEKRKVQRDIDDTLSMSHEYINMMDKAPALSVVISWIDLVYAVPDNKNPGQEYQILKGVYGHAEPGNLIALMGPSGAGKTTLLDVLAGRKTGGSCSGKILINGCEKNRAFKFISGYVEQFDSHESTQTVREAIHFSARLRLPEYLTEDEIADRTQETIDRLKLNSVADLQIGDDVIGGISPEYRKKTTIACELVMDPGLLFLDEPTTGLDSASARNVMQCVRELSRTRAVVCTIHQPSAEIFSVFDKMYLMQKGGRICFFGDVDKLVPYFEEHGFPNHNPSVNVADYALECSMKWNAACPGEYDTPADIFLQSDDYFASRGISSNMGKDLEEPYIDFSTYPGFVLRFKTVMARDWRRTFRRKDILVARLMLLTVVSLLVGWVYWQLENTQVGINSRVSCAFMLNILLAFSTVVTMPQVFAARMYQFREHESEMYGQFTAVFANFVCEFPLQLLQVFLGVTPAYWMSGLNTSFSTYLMFLLCASSTGFAQLAFFDVLISLVPNQEMFFLLFGTIFQMSLNLAGFFIPKSAIKVYWIWLYYFNHLRYSLASCLQVVLNDIHHIDGCGLPGNFCDGKDVVKYYNADQFSIWEGIAITYGFFVFYKLLAFVVQKNINHIQR